MFRSIRFALGAMLRRSRFEREMGDELRFHLEMRTEHLIATGLPPHEALRRARIEFGALDGWKDECRQARGLRLVDQARADLSYLGRMVRRSPGFAAVALLSIALGVGANTVVFSVVNGLLLRPLPVADPSRVVFVQSSRFPSHSFPDYRDFRDRSDTFEGLVGFRIAPMNVETGAGAARVWGYLATGNYFDVLGVKPLLGRVFHAADDRHAGGSPFAVISYDCWQSRFSGDRGIVGTTIRINRQPYTILGVAPPGFRGTERFYAAQIWVPMMMQAAIEPGNPWLEKRETFNTWIVGRLRRGVGVERAAANLNAIVTQLTREHPRVDHGGTIRLASPGLVGDLLGAPARAFAAGVLALSALVLLAACANLAGLFLARGADRQREFAVRLSVGARPGRLLRQLLTEALALAVAGGLAGCALAAAASRALTAWHAPLDFPVQFDVHVDGVVFLFALAISTMAGLLFGMIPAMLASRIDPSAALRSAEGGTFVRRLAMRDVLVVAQVALSFALLSACLLSLRGLQQALTMPLGFQPDGAVVVAFDLGPAGYTDAQGRAMQQRALQAVAGLPGVERAAYSNSLPLSIDQSNATVYAEGEAHDPSKGTDAIYYQVSPGFFPVLGVRLLQGRDFDAGDRSDSPLVAVVNETFARRVLHASRAVGRRFGYGPGGARVEVVGIVEDGKYQALAEAPQPAMFLPAAQSYNSTTTVVARAAVPPDRMIADVRAAITALDPQMPVYSAGSLRDLLGLALLPSRGAAVALGGFGVLALLIAATGIYGVTVHAVARRQREIGIRRAVGAGHVAVVRLVVARIAALLGIGAALGFLLALSIDGVLGSIVYGSSGRDPLVLSGVVAVMLVVSVFSAWAPARRALRVDPVGVLRSE